MSTAGQAIGGVVGAVAGFFIGGGPMGAVYGAQIGMSLGGYLDPPKGPEQQGPRLSDLSVQTSTYGAFIPRVYGTVAINGNVFWLEKNQLKEVVRKEESGGKGGGGGSSEVTTYSYYATLAIGLCEGPIGGIRRIWAGPNLVYDAGSDQLESIIASNQAAQKNFTFYLGTADQQPDSRMQADLGVANTSANRGLAYIVVRDFALAKYGNAIPAFKVEVVKSSPDAVPFLFGASVPQPTFFNFIGTCNPGGTGRNACFTAYDPSMARLWEMGSSGSLREITSFPLAYPASGYRVDSLYNSCLDQTGAWFISDTTGTRDLLAYANGGWRAYTSSRDYSEVEFIERAGHLWLRWKGDSTNPGDPPTFSKWCAKFSESGGVLTQGVRAAITTTARLAGTPAGELVATWFSDIAVGEAGTCSVFIYDESMNLDRSGSFVLPDYDCQYSSSASACFVDTNGVLHWVGTMFNSNFTNTDLFGKLLYVAYDTSAMATVKTLVLQDIVNDSGYLYPDSCRISDGVMYLAGGDNPDGSDLWRCAFSVSRLDGNQEQLSSIISAECLRTGVLTAADINVAGLDDGVTGYRVASIGSVRAAIEPLQGVFPFDALQSGYQLQFKPRGGSSVATIGIGELGVDEQLRQVREMDSQLPRKVAAKYMDKARNYDSNEQTWERPGTDAVNTRAMDLPIVLGAAQALQVVERLGYLYWLERVEFGPFQLPPVYGYLEPADVITLEAGYATYELRLTTVNYQSAGSLSCTARLNNAAVYQSLAESVEGPDGETVALAGESSYVLLDIPVVDEVLQNAPGMVAVMAGDASGWPGGVLYRSGDGGQTWQLLQAFVGKGTFGAGRGLLGNHAGNILQRGGSLTVDLVAGQLSSISEEQMLNGKNIAAYGADGRWEILRFANAVLNADGSYTLSLFWRGDRGTEWATALHQAGDAFVLLDDPDGAFIGLQSELIGLAREYRGVTAGADIDSDTGVSLTYQGVNLECLSPVHPKGVRNGSGDLAISWTRRTRIGGAWRDNVDASLGETSERYEVEVMSGTTVKRTLSSSTPSATYSAADQAADFGSPQSAITLRIYQLSELVGRGYPLETTL